MIIDHKPLVAIIENPCQRRLQSMLLRAQAYNYTISYRSGVQFLSPMPSHELQPPHNHQTSECEKVSSLAVSPFKPHRLSEIKQATAAGYILTELMDTIIKGWPNEKAKSRSASPRTLTTEMNSQYRTLSSSEESEWSFRHPCKKN